MKVCGVLVNAVVDTAVELAMISQQVYDKLYWHPELDFSTDVAGATMPVGFMGDIKFPPPVYVAPLQDEMLFQSEQGDVTHTMHKPHGVFTC